MRIKQSICYPLFMPADGNLEELAREAAEVGYKAIELWGIPPEIEEIVALAKRQRSGRRQHERPWFPAGWAEQAQQP